MVSGYGQLVPVIRYRGATLRLTTDHEQLTSVVRKGGLEPPHLSVPDPKSGASANSATFAGFSNEKE